MFMTRLSAVCTFAVLLHSHVLAQGIYTCVDAKGRKITSDRPIAECMDRAQQEISPTGTVRRVLLPPPTKQERAALEEKEKKDTEDRIKVAAEKLEKILDVANAELAKQLYLSGSHFGVTDIPLALALNHWFNLDVERQQDHTYLKAWIERIRAREHFLKVANIL